MAYNAAMAGKTPAAPVQAASTDIQNGTAPPRSDQPLPRRGLENVPETGGTGVGAGDHSAPQAMAPVRRLLRRPQIHRPIRLRAGRLRGLELQHLEMERRFPRLCLITEV